MSIPGSVSPLLLAQLDEQYKIERSLRFNSGDSAYLSRVFSVTGDRKKWSWSAWVKRTTNNQFQILFSSSGAVNCWIAFANASYGNGDFLAVNLGDGSGQDLVYTNAVFRDNSSWYHIVVTVDSDNATEANRLLIYVNGILQSRNGSITQGRSGLINQANTHNVGRNTFNSQYFNGYLADIHFIDGQALDPTSFAETDATTGQWVPKAYTGTYGTNGFRLAFADNSAATATTLGKDTSGNGNNWTPFNVQTATGGPTSVASASGALPIFNTTDTFGAAKGAGTRTDANGSSLVLAIPMDGSNNGTTFIDESPNIRGSGSAKTIVRNGDAKTSTVQSKFYGSSGFFDGTGDSLTITNSSDFTVDTFYTFEAWIYPTSNGAERTVFFRLQLSGGFPGYILRLDNGFPLIGSSSNDLTSSIPCLLNTWSHVAWVFNNTGTQRIYVNGILGASRTNGPSTMNFNDNLYIGAAPDNSRTFFGYIQDARVYRAEKYTSNFNPPTATQFPAVGAGNDSLVDTPTSYGDDTGAGGEVRGNYCTLNPLSSTGTMSNGNLDSATNAKTNYGTIAYPTTGKWYWECILGGSGVNVGLAAYRTNAAQVYLITDSCLYSAAGVKNVDGVLDVPFGSSSGSGDIIGVAANADTSTVEFFKNGVSMGTISHGVGGRFPVIGDGNLSQTATANFGQRPFAYTAPSGFKALCDTNLPAPVVAKPNTVFDVKLYTGNGGTNAITGLNFSPDLVWLKGRSSSSNHNLYDVIRDRKALFSNTTDAELTLNAGKDFGTFDSSGFTLLTPESTAINNNGQTFVAWTWDAGSSTVTNTDGSITSQVRANPSAGFSIVTATFSNAQGSIGHGLGAAPAFIIGKNREDSGTLWLVYHQSLGVNQYLVLSGTNSAATNSTFYNGVSSATFTQGGGWTNSPFNHVFYCFAPVAGYSAFGSYTGNGSADGPFVYTGFRPRWILVKRSNAADGWVILDSARDNYNLALAQLIPNLANAEDTLSSFFKCDFLSNGFKLRITGSPSNASGDTYIYAAFAENPFQYARAR